MTSKQRITALTVIFIFVSLGLFTLAYTAWRNSNNVTSQRIQDGTIQTQDLANELEVKIRLPDGQVMEATIISGEVTDGALADGSVLGATTENGDLRVIVKDNALVVQNPDGSVLSETIEAGEVTPSDVEVTGYSNISVTQNGDTYSIGVIQGPGSGLDSDTVDGLDGDDFMAAGTDRWVNNTGDSMTGRLRMNGSNIRLDGGNVNLYGGGVNGYGDLTVQSVDSNLLLEGDEARLTGRNTAMVQASDLAVLASDRQASVYGAQGAAIVSGANLNILAAGVGTIRTYGDLTVESANNDLFLEGSEARLTGRDTAIVEASDLAVLASDRQASVYGAQGAAIVSGDDLNILAADTGNIRTYNDLTVESASGDLSLEGEGAYLIGRSRAVVLGSDSALIWSDGQASMFGGTGVAIASLDGVNVFGENNVRLRSNGTILLDNEGPIDQVSFGSHAAPTVDGTYDLGDRDLRWRELYLAGNAHVGVEVISEEGLRVTRSGVTYTSIDSVGNIIATGRVEVGRNLTVGQTVTAQTVQGTDAYFDNVNTDNLASRSGNTIDVEEDHQMVFGSSDTADQLTINAEVGGLVDGSDITNVDVLEANRIRVAFNSTPPIIINEGGMSLGGRYIQGVTSLYASRAVVNNFVDPSSDLRIRNGRIIGVDLLEADAANVGGSPVVTEATFDALFDARVQSGSATCNASGVVDVNVGINNANVTVGAADGRVNVVQNGALGPNWYRFSCYDNAGTPTAGSFDWTAVR